MASNLLDICREAYTGYMEKRQCPYEPIHTKHISLDSDLSDEDLRLIRSQNLKTLELKNLQNCERFHTAIINNAQDGRNIVINLPETLKAYLSSPSQNILESLSVYGSDLVFTDNWMSETTKMLPSLVELDLSSCAVNNGDFEIMCSNLPKMKHLSLSSTDVTNITGISKLQDLEILDLADLAFESHEAIRELSTLQKLRVLDISGRTYTKLPNLKYYLQNGTVLSELRFLDVAQNKLVSHDIKQLGNTHKMLSKISVIGTSIERHNIETTNAELRLVKLGNLRECLESLRFYSAPYKFERIDHIIDSMMVIIRNDYENQLESDLHECFDFAVARMEFVIRDYPIRHKYLKLITELCHDGRSQMFSLVQKQNLFNVMFAVLRNEYHVNEWLIEAIYNSRALAWRILFEIYGELQTQDNINALHDVALLEIVRLAEPSSDFWQVPLSLLSQHYNQVSPEHLKQCSQHKRFLEKLISLSRRRHVGDLVFAQITRLIQTVIRRNQPTFAGEVGNVLNILMDIVVNYGQQNNDRRQKLTLLVVRELVVFTPPEVSETLFLKHSATVLFPLLRRKNDSQRLRRYVIGLWLSAFARTGGRKHGIKEKLSGSITEHINIVIRNIKHNRKAFTSATVPCQFWRTLESVMTDNKLIEWARWISNGCVSNNTLTN